MALLILLVGTLSTTPFRILKTSARMLLCLQALGLLDRSISNFLKEDYSSFKRERESVENWQIEIFQVEVLCLHSLALCMALN